MRLNTWDYIEFIAGLLIIIGVVYLAITGFSNTSGLLKAFVVSGIAFGMIIRFVTKYKVARHIHIKQYKSIEEYTADEWEQLNDVERAEIIVQDANRKLEASRAVQK